jgi:hypothetical protein
VKHECVNAECTGSLVDLRKFHGTPSEFWDALLSAQAQNFITIAEARYAQSRYAAEFEQALKAERKNMS